MGIFSVSEVFFFSVPWEVPLDERVYLYFNEVNSLNIMVIFSWIQDILHMFYDERHNDQFLSFIEFALVAGVWFHDSNTALSDIISLHLLNE